MIIVNWNAGDLLRTCVESIVEHANGLVGQIIVIDNGSTDGSEIEVEGLSNVLLVRMSANLGFGKACNIGAQEARSEYVLFLNPDAAIFSDTLPKVVTCMQDPLNAEVGICGVQLIDQIGRVSRSCSRFPTSAGFMVHALGLARILPNLAHRMTEWDHAHTRQVNQVIGAFFLVRRALFESLNGFDERFFVYFEEVDFSYRARKIGWRSLYLADAQAFHLGGGTSNQVKTRRLFYSLRSRLLYAFKHFSWMNSVVVLATTLLLEPCSRSMLALKQRSWQGLRETWAAFGLLWRWLPLWVFKGQSH
ncbi:MAG: glycosyltransferase family 2 protein [Alcaligenaceae bacterium]|nr:MAG: glycosyltransferase family 2 protein [Alcaligenaceae bacterium]